MDTSHEGCGGVMDASHGGCGGVVDASHGECVGEGRGGGAPRRLADWRAFPHALTGGRAGEQAVCTLEAGRGCSPQTAGREQRARPVAAALPAVAAPAASAPPHNGTPASTPAIGTASAATEASNKIRNNSSKQPGSQLQADEESAISTAAPFATSRAYLAGVDWQTHVWCRGKEGGRQGVKRRRPARQEHWRAGTITCLVANAAIVGGAAGGQQ